MKIILNKWIFRIIILVLFTGLVPKSLGNALSIASPTAEQKKKSAVTKKSSKKDKKKALSYYKRGLKKAKKKDYKGALKDLKISYKLNPSKKVKKQIDKLTSLLDKEKKPAVTKKSSKKDKKKALSYYKRGLKKAKKKDYKGALKDLKISYKLNPNKKVKAKLDKIRSLAGEIKTAQKSKKKKKKDSIPPSSKIAEMTGKPPVIPPQEIQNPFDIAGEIQGVIESLHSTSRKLEFATQNLRSSVSGLKPVLKKLENRVEREPENNQLKRKLGLMYENSQKSEEAKDIYLDLIQQDPANPDNHFFLGSLYASLGDLNKARYLFEEALNLKPDHQPTLEAMYSYLDAGDTKKMSKVILAESIHRNPGGSIQQMTIIRGKLENELFDEAITLAEAGLDQYPNHSGFLYLKGIGLEQKGEVEQAKYSYQSAIRFDPKNQDNHLALANLYYNRAQFLYAALSFSDAATLNPGDIDSRYMQGLSYFNAGEWSRTVSAWEDLLHFQPEHPLVKNLLPQVYYILAIEYNRTGKYSRSRTSFENAMSVNHNTDIWLPGAMRILGKHYQEKAMYRESLNAYQEVIELRPKDSGAYLGLGITYWKMGENLMAKGAWKKSLELNPENNEAKGWLIVAQQKS